MVDLNKFLSSMPTGGPQKAAKAPIPKKGARTRDKGEPAKEVRFNIRLSEHERRGLNMIALENNLSVNRMARAAMNDWLTKNGHPTLDAMDAKGRQRKDG